MTLPGPAGIAGLLRRPPLDALAELAAAHPARVALVGGALRDAWLGFPPRDLDLVVEDDLSGFLATIAERIGRHPAAIGDRFQDTHRFRWKNLQIDVARTLGTLEEDLGRRDFSVNALALPLPAAGVAEIELVDPHGGIADLRAGRLRETAPGVIATDPLRAQRAVRYAVALPGFELTPSTRAAVIAAAPRLAEVAAERKVVEWGEILQLTRWIDGLYLAHELGVLEAALGPVEALTACRAWAADEGDGAADARARLAALVADLAATRPLERIIEELRAGRWPRSLVAHAGRVAQWHRQLDAYDRELAGRALEDPAAAADAAELARRRAALAGEAPAAGAQRLWRYATRAAEERWVRGADLLDIGLEPGERVGEMLEEIAVGQVTRRWDDRAGALGWAREQIGEGSR